MVVRLLAIALFVLPLACGPDGGPEPQVIEYDYLGMVKIRAGGHSFMMGGSDSSAAADEKPAMPVTLSYDYWLDTSEVTIARWAALMGRLPAEYDSLGVADSSEPVCWVSWCDAIRFCNRRSIALGLDTAYSYLRADSTADGRVYRLVGLAADLRVEACRLPTEAEWEFAARAGQTAPWPWGTTPDAAAAAQYAWFEQSSDNRAHPVCKLTPNAFGLFDMLGNALEWAGDIKMAYRAQSVSDPIGAPPPATDETDRPVRGGGFAHPLEQLRFSNRTDLYETVSSTATRYIGFRCAVAPVPAGRYVADSGAVATANPLRLVLADVAPVTGSRRSKLAFVNRSGGRHTLAWADWSGAAPVIYEHLDRSDVRTPSISPDGKLVAFATAGEGRVDGSTVWIRPLLPAPTATVALTDSPAFAPRWWTDPVAGDTFLVYATSTIINSGAGWRGTQTRRVRMAGGAPSGPFEVICSTGSYHGGLSPDGRYLATGFSLLRMRDVISGEERVLFTGPQNGKAAGDTSQVCNLSISRDPDAPDRALFLDFGSYGVASTLTGDAYDMHEYLFVASWDGTVVRHIRCPQGTNAWDHPEWSNAPGLAAAGVSAADYTRPAVYIVNLADSVCTRAVEGTDLWEPNLWVYTP